MCYAGLQLVFYECESEVIRETSLCWRPIWTKPYFFGVIIVQFAYWCAVLVPRTSKRTGINVTDTPILCTVPYWYGTLKRIYITVPYRYSTLQYHTVLVRYFVKY